MEIRLLGDLEVVADGVAGTLPGSGERAVLALLAMQAGRTVSADRLVDELWGERLPANPANALQTRVSKLRRQLGALGADGAAVVTAAPGYRLELDRDRVDALRFERLVAEARAAGDADRYAEALALWRGPALADLGDWAEAEAARLEDLRLTALQERIELDLLAGRHLDVVPELEALVAANPLRERLSAQLMLALYRSGRQADALAVYRRLREELDTRLGLDPSPELRELEAAILRQDPSLGAPPAEPARRKELGNLPARVDTLVGRDADVGEVAALAGTARLVTVTGPGGAGKTTLALEAARRLADGFDDGAWFIDLSGASADDDVAAVVAGTLGLSPGDSAGSRAAFLAGQLRDDRRLLVLDNCEHVVDAAAALADRLLAGCPRVRVLATSREALAVAGEVQYALAPLSLPDAVELFTRRARAVARDFQAPAPEVAEVCARLDGMPLAIELAAARVRTLSVAEITARLSDRFKLLVGRSRTAAARHQTLRATVDWSYQLLPSPSGCCCAGWPCSAGPGRSTPPRRSRPGRHRIRPGRTWTRPTCSTCSTGSWTARWW